MDDLDLDLHPSVASVASVDMNSLIQEREPMTHIDTYFIYMDSDMSIENITSHVEPLYYLKSGSLDMGITKDRLLEMIQRHRLHNHKKYKLLHFLFFHVPLEHEQLASFIKHTSMEYPDFMKSPSYLTDLSVDTSISIFHDINSIFFFFKSTEWRTLSKTAKSMPTDDDVNRHRSTKKKVRFQV